MNTRLRKIAIVTALAGITACPAAFAQERYIGEVMLVGFTFCPRGTTDANGQLLAISSNTALFSLYGTTYGGDGRTTFALPDLRGRVPLHFGTGPGLDTITQGQRGGQEDVAITIANMPSHTHSAQLKGTAANGNTDSPAGAVPARLPRSNVYKGGSDSDAAMGAQITIGSAGNGQPIPVRDPYLGMRYCVVLTGIFPSRN